MFDCRFDYFCAMNSIYFLVYLFPLLSFLVALLSSVFISTKTENQIGFARVISDFSTIAYLGDIYILENHRGKGLSKKLMEVIVNHPNLQNLRRWILLTSTADWLYQKYGFTKLPKPEIYMELFNPNVFLKK